MPIGLPSGREVAAMFSWDFNTATLSFIGLQIVLLIVFLVKTNGKASIAHDLATEAKKLANDAHTNIDVQGRRFGEVVEALKEKINLDIVAVRKEITDDQKYVRDTFVRRESFYKIADAMHAQMAQLGEKVDNRFERLESKIDRKIQP